MISCRPGCTCMFATGHEHFMTTVGDLVILLKSPGVCTTQSLSKYSVHGTVRVESGLHQGLG